jgi:heme-degrading monooxygenase HmoA
MAIRKPLDPRFPIADQFAIEAAPVILENLFHVDLADEQAFLKAWQEVATFMKNQAGFISAQLHRAVGPSPTFLATSHWESVASVRMAFADPVFAEKIALYPETAIGMPHLFQKVAVPGICLG